jgi:hypothetical protein
MRGATRIFWAGLTPASVQLVVHGHGWERWGLFPAELQRFYDLVEATRAPNLTFTGLNQNMGQL